MDGAIALSKKEVDFRATDMVSALACLVSYYIPQPPVGRWATVIRGSPPLDSAGR